MALPDQTRWKVDGPEGKKEPSRAQREAMRATLEVALRTSVGWQVVAGLPSIKTEKARWRGVGTLQEQLDLQKEGPTSFSEHIC